jgi:hypothetical protein
MGPFSLAPLHAKPHNTLIMKRTILSSLLDWIPALVLTATTAASGGAANPWLGAWELTLPGGGAGWLGVEERGGQLQASLLWGGGSVFPLDSARVNDGKLVVTRVYTEERKDVTGKAVKTRTTETITATASGDDLKLVTVKPRANGSGEDKAEFTGKRQPPLPPAPDLSMVKFGEPISLFNGKDLAGWRLLESGADNGWRAKDGVLVNDAAQEEGKPRKHYGNLRTEREFEDFNLKLEMRVAKGGNSGVYLRGIYEVQVADTYGKPLDPHNMGAIYSRITPTSAAEKPAGEWQTLDITLVDRHATVVLNGTKIVDNQPLAGCTGGALWSDVSRPGPIYLQGDHTGIEYRNLVLRPRLE